ncbi:cathepsin F [Dermatophagoides farinae]|uniref:Cysteine proteinase n=1 Tax=Dermatophagoides farinae TaxID=6954 RepID=A0A922HZA5_DERFA|nr:putative cysteine proteinase CG12163 [Dermatophagoides farinae]KAH7645822.1 putative cysteine proteinase [Dermatophagoides farinae]KAH9516045.1 hypothetical protein DERF_006809 [Dermatophagoides farinae]
MLHIILTSLFLLSLSSNIFCNTNEDIEEINHLFLDPSHLFPLLKNEVILFEEFIRKHNKPYRNDLAEKAKRFKIFRQNLLKIRMLNQNELGSAVYGITPATDMTYEEFKHHLGLRPDLYTPNEEQPEIDDYYFHDNAPDSFDWRQKLGVVSSVKNQEQCGSCWAFSATGNIEGVWALKRNESVSLSEQELVDCDTLDNGCGGGLPTNAFKTVIQLGGIESETDYPYDAENEKCHFKKSLSHVKIDSYVELPKNETYIKNYLYHNGPISIGINANAMQFYFGGISHPPNWLCNPSSLDHGVLIVGYGTGKTRILHKIQPYWIIKNSWGRTWGEKGYYRVYRGSDTCGVSQMASSAVVN